MSDHHPWPDRIASVIDHAKRTLPVLEDDAADSTYNMALFVGEIRALAELEDLLEEAASYHYNCGHHEEGGEACDGICRAAGLYERDGKRANWKETGLDPASGVSSPPSEDRNEG